MVPSAFSPSHLTVFLSQVSSLNLKLVWNWNIAKASNPTPFWFVCILCLQRHMYHLRSRCKKFPHKFWLSICYSYNYYCYYYDDVMILKTWENNQISGRVQWLYQSSLFWNSCLLLLETGLMRAVFSDWKTRNNELKEAGGGVIWSNVNIKNID